MKPPLKFYSGRENSPFQNITLPQLIPGCSDRLASLCEPSITYLHDIIEDCGYTGDQLEKEIGDSQVRELVEWVTEFGSAGPDGKKLPWEVRNRNYLERIRKAPGEALTLSCADKTSNIREMCYWLERGYETEDFTSRDHATNLAKFEALDDEFRGEVIAVVYYRFKKAIDVFSGF